MNNNKKITNRLRQEIINNTFSRMKTINKALQVSNNNYINILDDIDEFVDLNIKDKKRVIKAIRFALLSSRDLCCDKILRYSPTSIPHFPEEICRAWH